MALSEQVSLADVKNRLSEVVERIEREHGRVVITKHGRAAAVILSVEDLESLEETLAILSNPALMDEIREAERDVARRRTKRLEKAQAHLPRLLAQLAPGQELTITEQGQPLTHVKKAERTSWPCKAGSAKSDAFWMAPDFDAPLDDFQDYME